DPVTGLQARPALGRAVADADPHRDARPDFDACAGNLAIAHRRVDVADIEKRAFDLRAEDHPASHRREDRVDVAAVLADIGRADRLARRRNADDTDHWPYREAELAEVN